MQVTIRLLNRLQDGTTFGEAGIDLTAPVDWPRHVTAKGVASEETLLGTHDKYHLCSNGFSFYLVHLQF